MNVCKVPDMCKDMEYKYITEDSKTRYICPWCENSMRQNMRNTTSTKRKRK